MVGKNKADFGKYPAKLKKEFSFIIKNNGDELLKITKIRNTCACADLKIGDRELKPGKETELKGAVRADSIYGKYNKKIYIQSNVTGESQLDVEIIANNESGGELDFGIVSMVTRGRERLIVEGNDARILVNNIEVKRNTNEINDVISGLSLTLKKTDPDTNLTITVARDNEGILSKIEDFVKTYNTFIDFVNENSKYDKEEQTVGPLLGDLTTRTVLSRIRSALQKTVFNGDFAYNQLVQVGIETTVDGKLSFNKAKFNEAMTKDINSIISLFTATREASDNDISFSYHSTKTKSGTYSVTITRAAEMAAVLSDEFDDSIEVSGVLSITDSD